MNKESLIQSIIKTIKANSKEQNCKISELLRKARVSPHIIDDWQSGKSDPSFSVLFRLCDVLNIEMRELFTENEDALTDSQKAIIEEWCLLSPMQKEALFLYIDAMKSNH